MLLAGREQTGYPVVSLRDDKYGTSPSVHPKSGHCQQSPEVLRRRNHSVNEGCELSVRMVKLGSTRLSSGSRELEKPTQNGQGKNSLVPVGAMWRYSQCGRSCRDVDIGC